MGGHGLEYILRYTILALLDRPEATMLDITRMLTDKEFRKETLTYCRDTVVLQFWNVEFASWNDKFVAEAIAPVLNKVGAFTANPIIRNIIGQPKSTFNIRQIMDEGKILIVNLSKGLIGEDNAAILGSFLVTKIQLAAMSRSDIPDVRDRRPFYLYVDEFQNFATDSFESILSEARKYKLSLIMGNQFMTQLTDKIREAIIGNVGTVISGRIGVTDAELMVKKFQPTFDVDDLAKLPNFQSITSVMINNVPSAPFSMNWIPPMGQVNNQLRDALVRLSAAKYGRPRAVVEKEIFDRIRGSVQPKTSPSQLAPSANQKTPGGSSFLDEWLAKRQQLGGKPASNSTTVRPVNSQVPQASSQIQNPQGRPGVVNNAPSNINSVNATTSNLDSKQQSQPFTIDSAVVNRTNVSMATNNNPVSSANVKPSQPVVKNRLDLRNGDDDDSEVMISLR